MQAQPQSATQTSDKAAKNNAQTIVIIANRRLEKQREVADTVSVLGGSDLERPGARATKKTLSS